MDFRHLFSDILCESFEERAESKSALLCYNGDMSQQEIKKRVEKLRAEIDRFRYEYHVLDKPDISGL